MVLTEMAPTDMESDPFMSHAMKMSDKATMRFKLGAVLVKKGKIISKGTNSKKTHPKYGSGNYMCLHAEGHAIWRAVRRGHDVSGTTLYVYRQNGNLAKPCKGCQALIREFEISQVFYSNNG